MTVCWLPTLELRPRLREEKERKEEEERAESRMQAQALVDHAASLPKRMRKKKRKRKLPKSSSRSSSGHGRPCDHQRRVPAVQEVRVPGASDSVHRRRLDILVVQRQVRGFLVQKTVVVPQLLFFVGRRHSFRAADADPHGPVCSADHGDSTVAAYFGGRCSCCRIVQILRCCRGEALTQLQLVEKSVIFYVPSYSAVTRSVFAFEVQDSRLLLEMTSGFFPYPALFGSTLDTCIASVYGDLVSSVPRSCRQRQLVLLVSTHFALCFLLCSQALMSYIMAGMDQKDFFVAPQLQIVITQRPFPIVQPVWPTTEVSQLQFALGGRCPWYAVVQVSVQLQFINVVVTPLSLRRVYPMVQTVRRTIEIPSCSSTR